ncbi:helix-turn-helix domain-containing protein [Nocardia cyriacigeorgica]|uniref:helix-turn-helix transcriptional regulator n=1 Tax=Nocardia cyriacigeorgica TaxID=135487 RepID=UPI0018957B03|nr:helix-turn-helix domain-containing protein [Nocardia cyriacigeorgica]MBF6082899.1 helix-turn-helix domain-containing protein [Nocardia cyriacigeorgica]
MEVADEQSPDVQWRSRKQVAEFFGVPEQTLAQWAYKKTGPRFYRIGRYTRYKLSDCISWAEQQQTGGTEPM